MIVLAILLIGSQALRSTPDLGKAGAICYPGNPGPSFLVEVVGLKDRRGLLKLELYPANDRDFLADDNILISEGKTFRRIEVPIARSGPTQLCIRAPRSGTYALSLMHDRDGDHRFALSEDGIGFSGNPKLGWSKPRAASARANIQDTPVELRIVINYRKGLFSFGPAEGR